MTEELEQGVPAAEETPAAPHIGTLDVDMVIGKLLDYKNNPGKQVITMNLAGTLSLFEDIAACSSLLA